MYVCGTWENVIRTNSIEGLYLEVGLFARPFSTHPSLGDPVYGGLCREGPFVAITRLANILRPSFHSVVRIPKPAVSGDFYLNENPLES